MLKLFNWLFGHNEKVKTVSVVEEVSVKEVKETVKKEEKKEGFIDSKTGKVYKTERAMKAAATRRKNAAKKKKAKK